MGFYLQITLVQYVEQYDIRVPMCDRVTLGVKGLGQVLLQVKCRKELNLGMLV